MNLLINGAEAMEGKIGDIVVSTFLQHIHETNSIEWQRADEHLASGRYVVLEVADSGCGMDTDTIRKIFDPFYTTKFTGRGLGLAAVLGIVRGHKGGLRVESEVGKGTIFCVAIPLTEPPVQQPETVSSLDTRQALNATILLIDDEELVREVFADMVHELSIKLLMASGGEEGISMYQQQRDAIDLVVLDLSMPGIDGEETFKRLKAINPDVKVVLSSGYAEEEVATRFAGMGLSGFVQKPYRWAELGPTLRKFMHS
jgi:signal transduction histidine kinase